MPCPWGLGPAAEVDRHSLNPLLDWLRATRDRETLTTGEPPPTMFSTGDLPTFIASGLDVDLLRWCHWAARHTAAQTTDPGTVYRIVEDTAAGLIAPLINDNDPQSINTPDGRRSLSDYSGRMFRWAIVGLQPAPSAPVTAEEYEQMWGVTGQRAGGASR